MKTCEQFHQWIWLSQYNELTSDEKKLLDEHIASCVHCQLNLQEAEKTINLLNQKIQVQPTENQLRSSREELHQRLLFLKQKQTNRKWVVGFWQIISMEFAPRYRLVTALVMLFVGVLVGKFFLAQPQPSVRMDVPALSNIAEVEYIQYNPNTKQVSIRLNTIQQNIIQGDLETPEVQQILTHALMMNKQPNVRLKTVGVLSTASIFNRPVLEALIKVIESDENPGVRLKAIKLINTMPVTSHIKELLINVLTQIVLNEDNLAIQKEAVDGLIRISDPDIEPLLLSIAKTDTNEYIQYKVNELMKRSKIQRLNSNF